MTLDELRDWILQRRLLATGYIGHRKAEMRATPKGDSFIVLDYGEDGCGVYVSTPNDCGKTLDLLNAGSEYVPESKVALVPAPLQKEAES